MDRYGIEFQTTPEGVADWLARSQKVLATTTIHSTFSPIEGEGVYLFGLDGKWRIDFTSLVGVSNLGHGSAVHPIQNAVRAHEDETGLSHTMTHDWPNPWATMLAERLIPLLPGDFAKKVYFSNSGSEAIEAAIKLLLSARPEQTVFLAFPHAFHGRGGYALPLIGARPVRTRGYPRAYTVIRIPFPRRDHLDADETPSSVKHWTPEHYIELVEEIVGPFRDEVNALVIEPEQGEGGMNSAEAEYLLPLAAYCKENDIKIVADEIQTGFGRTGKMFACDHFPGFVPDIIALAKSICAGTEILGATVFDATLDFTEPGRHANTFGGNSSACVAAMETIRMIQDVLDANSDIAQSSATYLRVRLDHAIKTINRKSNRVRLAGLRGLGWMLGVDILSKTPSGAFELNPDLRDRIVRCAEENGLLLLGCGKAAIRFMPPIIITDKEIDEAMTILENLPIWETF